MFLARYRHGRLCRLLVGWSVDGFIWLIHPNWTVGNHLYVDGVDATVPALALK